MIILVCWESGWLLLTFNEERRRTKGAFCKFKFNIQLNQVDIELCRYLVLYRGGFQLKMKMEVLECVNIIKKLVTCTINNLHRTEVRSTYLSLVARIA